MTLKRYFFIALCGGRYWTFLHLNPDGSVTWPLGLYINSWLRNSDTVYIIKMLRSNVNQKSTAISSTKNISLKKKKMAEMAVA